MSSVCGGRMCSKRSECKRYEGNYFEFHDVGIADYRDYSMPRSGTIELSMSTIKRDCGNFSIGYPLFDPITDKDST